MRKAAFVIAACIATLAPFSAGKQGSAHTAVPVNAAWPREYEGRALAQLPLSEKELSFSREFPGQIGRFTDGYREIIIRHVTAPTRKLHPAADCFRAIGYSVAPRPARRDASGRPMSCIAATRHNERLEICEAIHSADGRSWPDVSAWYWSALFSSEPPMGWWSYVIAERS